jgi:hypothetical protein
MRYASIYASLTVSFLKKKPQRLLRPLESHTWASAEHTSIIDALRMVVGTLPYRLLARSEEQAATAEERIQKWLRDDNSSGVNPARVAYTSVQFVSS